MSPPIVAITFPAATAPGTTIRTTDGINWTVYPGTRPGVFFGTPDGEHGVGVHEFPPGTRITAEALSPDRPLDAAFWGVVERWWADLAQMRAAKKSPRV